MNICFQGFIKFFQNLKNILNNTKINELEKKLINYEETLKLTNLINNKLLLLEQKYDCNFDKYDEKTYMHNLEIGQLYDILFIMQQKVIDLELKTIKLCACGKIATLLIVIPKQIDYVNKVPINFHKCINDSGDHVLPICEECHIENEYKDQLPKYKKTDVRLEQKVIPLEKINLTYHICEGSCCMFSKQLIKNN